MFKRKKPDMSDSPKKSLLRRTFFIFSVVFFFIILAGGTAVFIFAMGRLGNARMETDLTLSIETMRLRIANSVNTELSLVFKMADVPLIKRYLQNPQNPQLKELAFEEFAAYRRNFKSNTVFWISDVDKVFFWDDAASYVVDPKDPEAYWYDMTLYETERYNFNINYNSEMQQTNLWVNAPVFDQGKPIGMVGSGIDLSEFIVSMYRTMDARIDLYLFNTFDEITIARDLSLVFDKKDIAAHIGRHGEKITETARQCQDDEIKIIPRYNVKYAVGRIPLLNWYVAASIPITTATLFDPTLSAIFSGVILLIIIIFGISNVFVAIIQTTVDRQTQRLLELKDAAETANRAKSSFLASTSHEIRTPMNAIIGMSELALREELSREVREYVSEIRQAGGNLLAIINDILDLSKIESGKFEITEREYTFSSLVNDCTAIVRSRLTEKSLEFVTAFDPGLPNRLRGDEARLRQTIVNLLSNAVKYTDEGKITFTIRGEPLPGARINLVIAVADTGIGIKPEDLPNLFGQFNRFDSQKNISVEGTGLGLAISQNLCRLMGGEITVESEYGKGSTFTARIPQTVTDSSPFKIIEQSKAASAFDTRFIAPGAVVLVVDDIATNLVVAKGLLSPYRITVHTCLSGAEAVDNVQTGHYDLVLMDHMMPGMDGIEAVKRIREFNKEIPVIALTANAITGMREMFLEKGFNDYLSKPIEIAKLNGILEKWIPEEKQKKGRGTRDLEKGTGDWGLGTGENDGGLPEFQKAALSTPLSLPDVDVEKGIALTGGTVSGYKKVLSMFQKDAKERLALLQNPPSEAGLPVFTTHVHALKSALAAIGAAALSNTAAELEKAGIAGDTGFIRSSLGAFTERLTELAAEIDGSLQDTAVTKEAANEGKAADLNALMPLLRELRDALEGQKADNIDRLLEELGKKAPDAKTLEALEKISNDVLMAEFGNAMETVTVLLENNN